MMVQVIILIGIIITCRIVNDSQDKKRLDHKKFVMLSIYKNENS